MECRGESPQRSDLDYCQSGLEMDDQDYFNNQIGSEDKKIKSVLISASRLIGKRDIAYV